MNPISSLSMISCVLYPIAEIVAMNMMHIFDQSIFVICVEEVFQIECEETQRSFERPLSFIEL